MSTTPASGPRSFPTDARPSAPDCIFHPLPVSRSTTNRLENGYRSAIKHAAGDDVAPLARPVRIVVDDLLP